MYQSLVSILCFLFLFSSPLMAARYPNVEKPWYAEEQYLTKIQEYFSTKIQHILPLNDQESEGTLEILQVIQTETDNAVYFVGKLTVGDSAYFSFFLIQKSWLWKEIDVKLLYISKSDQLITPRLLMDVLIGASGFLPKDPFQYDLLIENREGEELKSSQSLQIWTFSTPGGSKERLEVLLEFLESGGTDFKITRLESES